MLYMQKKYSTSDFAILSTIKNTVFNDLKVVSVIEIQTGF